MEIGRQHSDIVQRLQRDGVRLAIDDFGTGYSSLDYLRHHPVDQLKIAQQFIARIIDSPGDAAIAKAAIGMAHEMGIAVVAEGVETREQLDLLRGWGCNVIQGYCFAPPLAVEEMTSLLRCDRPFAATADADGPELSVSAPALAPTS
jgi:EAL domain-containing protein (putative c-di-GMP-specific phosphodiesterase class I)